MVRTFTDMSKLQMKTRPGGSAMPSSEIFRAVKAVRKKKSGEGRRSQF
jgi:hypothetical protein